MNASTPEDDEDLVDAIYDQISEEPAGEEQHTFCLVWDAGTLIGRGGFQSLLEQSPALEEYEAAFVRAGMPDAAALFQQFRESIPAELRTAGQVKRLFEWGRSRFEEIKALSYQFYDVASEWPTDLMRYVREHADHFPARK